VQISKCTALDFSPVLERRDVNQLNGSEAIANATLIRLNAERGTQLEELGRQTKILVDRLKERTPTTSTQATGSEDVPLTGS
jgi:hypothetical protein